MCRRFDSAPRHHRPASAVGPSTADFRRRATPALSGDRTREIRRTEEPAKTGRWCSVRAVVGWSTDTRLRVSRLDGRNRLPALGRPSHRRLIAGSSPARPPAPSPVIVGLEAERPPPGRRSEDVRTPAEHRPECTAGPSGLRCRQIPGTTAEGGAVLGRAGGRARIAPGFRPGVPAHTGGDRALRVGRRVAVRRPGGRGPVRPPRRADPGAGAPGGRRDYRAGLPRNYREGEEASAVSVICPRSAR